MEIKDIKLEKDKPFEIRWKNLTANIIDDGRFFSATSFNGQYCCTGSIVVDDDMLGDNPLLNVLYVYKLTQTRFEFQDPNTAEDVKGEEKRYYVDFYDMIDGWGTFGFFTDNLFADLNEAKKKCNELQAKLGKRNKQCGEHYGVIDGKTHHEVYCLKEDIF